jgi:dienelactone hydrolase
VSVGKDLTFARRGETPAGYLAAPDAAAAPPTIAWVPDVRGSSDLYREVSKRFAARGFAALAVDLYSREVARKLTGPAQAMAWIAAVPDAHVLGDLPAAVDRFSPSAAELFARPAGARKRFGIESYAGGYTFLNQTWSDAFRPEAAVDAFERSVAFLELHLSPRA